MYFFFGSCGGPSKFLVNSEKILGGSLAIFILGVLFSYRIVNYSEEDLTLKQKDFWRKYRKQFWFLLQWSSIIVLEINWLSIVW